MANRSNEWHIKGVDEATKRAIKVYAAQHGLTLAQALAELVDQALGPSL